MTLININVRDNTCRRKIGDNLALSRPSGHFSRDLECKAVRGMPEARIKLQTEFVNVC